MTFGIPKIAIPIDENGKVTTAVWEKRMRILKRPNISDEPSDATPSDKSIITPGPFDVIMGRGRHATNAPGNLRFKKALQTYQTQYEQADKFQKTVIAEIIVQRLKEEGSRFLRRPPSQSDIGEVVDDEKARAKISHAFRNLRLHITSSNEARLREKRLNDNGINAIGLELEPRLDTSSIFSSQAQFLPDNRSS